MAHQKAAAEYQLGTPCSAQPWPPRSESLLPGILRYRPCPHEHMVLFIIFLLLSYSVPHTFGLNYQPAVVVPVDAGPRGVVLGDVNGDSKMDIITANDISGSISVLLGFGNGTFQPQVAYPIASNNRGPVAVGIIDINNDGKPDLISVNRDSNTTSLLLGLGGGTFQLPSATETFPVGGIPYGLAIGDVNQDSLQDVVVSNHGSNTISVLLNNGNVGFQPQQIYPVGNQPHSMAIGDLDNDVYPDVVTGNALSNDVSVLFNNGNGTFKAELRFAVSSEPFSVTIGDVNFDGAADIVVANFVNNTIGVLLNQRNGSFQTQQVYALQQQNPSCVVIRDLNADTFPDIAVANRGSNSTSVLLNYGNGTFQAEQVFALGSEPKALTVGDVNGDSGVDIVAVNYSSNTTSILLFSFAATTTIPSTSVITTSTPPITAILSCGSVSPPQAGWICVNNSFWQANGNQTQLYPQLNLSVPLFVNGSLSIANPNISVITVLFTGQPVLNVTGNATFGGTLVLVISNSTILSPGRLLVGYIGSLEHPFDQVAVLSQDPCLHYRVQAEPDYLLSDRSMGVLLEGVSSSCHTRSKLRWWIYFLVSLGCIGIAALIILFILYWLRNRRDSNIRRVYAQRRQVHDADILAS